MCKHYGENGLSIEASAGLFSRDRDRLPEEDGYTREEYIENCGHEPTWATNYTLQFDYTRFQAFPQVAAWNEKDITDIPFPQPRGQTALHPETATTIDAGYLHDGSASVYAVAPSMALRDELGDGTTLLLRGETTIRGAQSYRVKLPDGLNDTTGPRREYYTIDQHRVEGTCLLEGDWEHTAGELHENKSETVCLQNDPLATGNGLHSAEKPAPGERRHAAMTFDYTVGMANELSYVSTFKYRVQRTVVGCDDWNTSTESCEGKWWPIPGNSTTYYSSAVDGFNAEFYSQPSPTAEVAEYPDGEMEFIIKAGNSYGYRVGWDALFTRIRFGEQDEYAGWAWQVFSARRPAWEYLIREGEVVRSLNESVTHPLQNYAVPIAATTEETPGTGLDSSVGIQVGELLRSSPPVHTPSIDDRILIAAPEPEYRLPKAVSYHSEEALDFEEAEVVGLLDGTNTTGVHVERRVDVRDSNITAEIEEAGEDEMEVTVTLRGVRDTPEGVKREPLSTADSMGYVTVNGQQVETDEDGEATVIVDQGAYVAVEYYPADWKENDNDIAYLPKSKWIRTESFDAVFLLQLIIELVILFFPFILVLLAVRSIAQSKPTTST